MSLSQSLADSVRDKARPSGKGMRSGVSITPAKPASIAATSGSPAVSTIVPAQSSGGTGLGMAKKLMNGGGAGMGAKNGVGFPKKASMASGSASSGIKGPTKLGKGVRGSMK